MLRMDQVRTALDRDFASATPTSADLAEITQLVRVVEEADGGQADVTEDDIAADWARPSFDQARDAVLVRDASGNAVGHAEVYQGRRAEVVVHPSARGRGVGSWLREFTEIRAREVGSSLVGQTVSDNAHEAQELLRDAGYEALWTSWILEGDVEALAGRPAPNTGLDLTPLAGDHELETVYRIIEDAFSEWPDREPSSYEDWHALVVQHGLWDPQQVLIARVDEEPVGALVGRTYDSDGWVHQMAVRADQRRRGIAGTMLQAAFDMYAARGTAKVGLGTDSRTGALGLYERTGMRVERSWTHLALRL